MPRLLVITEGSGPRLYELRLGSNRIGRSPQNEFPIPHPTISTFHCELVLSQEGVTLNDMGSTNGTFVGGQRVGSHKLTEGQSIRLGDVELRIENTEIRVSIPKFANPELPAPPVLNANGSMLCQRHPQSAVSHRCTRCQEVMCPACVHRMRRRGGQIILLLCPLCSQPVEPLGGPEQPQKKSLITRAGESIRRAFRAKTRPPRH